MAITCKWECIMGKVSYKGQGFDFELTLYGGGNVYAVFCYDYENEKGEKCHTLHDFIVDKDHLKRILEDENHYNDYHNFRLNGAYSETWQIAKLLVKHGHEVTIYHSKK